MDGPEWQPAGVLLKHDEPFGGHPAAVFPCRGIRKPMAENVDEENEIPFFFTESKNSVKESGELCVG
jgi:hypothetical protein